MERAKNKSRKLKPIHECCNLIIVNLSADSSTAHRRRKWHNNQRRKWRDLANNEKTARGHGANRFNNRPIPDTVDGGSIISTLNMNNAQSKSE